jgi:hypothetical protein
MSTCISTNTLHIYALCPPTIKIKDFCTFIPIFLKLSAPTNMVQVGDVFLLMEAARNAVQQHVLDNSKSYKTSKSNKKRSILLCKDS